MTHEQKVIRLQTWWMGELKKLTQTVMNTEAKRQEKEKQKAYKELEEYRSEDEILDAYGFGCITERKKDRLIDLWMKREYENTEDPLYRMKLEMLQDFYQQAKQIAMANGAEEKEGEQHE